MAGEDRNPYPVAAGEGGHAVCSGSGRVIVVCRDEGSARQYAVMLHEAWRLGYKAGFRKGRQASG